MSEEQRQALRAVRDAIAERTERGRAAAFWGSIDPVFRAMAIMAATNLTGDARQIARQPWATFTGDQQAEIAAACIAIGAAFKGAEALRAA